jgi:hypothetical protein
MVLLLCTTRSVVRIVGVTLDVVPFRRNTPVMNSPGIVGRRPAGAAAPGTTA